MTKYITCQNLRHPCNFLGESVSASRRSEQYGERACASPATCKPLFLYCGGAVARRTFLAKHKRAS